MTETLKVNRDMFREIHDLTEMFPELHAQECWQAPSGENGRCGTTRCIAGWAVWLKAREMGLINRKRDTLDIGMLRQVGRQAGADMDDVFGWDSLYEVISRKILGLDNRAANSLFHDMNNARVLDRLKSYADHGHDLSHDQLTNWK